MPPSKMATWFEDRRWRVVTEADGQGFVPYSDEAGSDGYIPVTFRQGAFVIGVHEPPGAFKSPLSGNPGVRGILLQEVDAEGNDIEGSRHPFGEPAVKEAREKFGAIVG